MIKSCLTSILAYKESASLISQLKLWKAFAIPILISVVLAVLITGLAWSLTDILAAKIAPVWKWETGKQFFFIFSEIISFLCVFLLGLLVYKHLLLALCAPFMSPISEKIEAHLLQKEKVSSKFNFWRSLRRGIQLNGRNLVIELLLSIPLMMLSFIPVIGIIFTILLIGIQAYFAGFGNIDYTLERHLTYKESIRFVNQNKGLAIGNGLGFILLSLIPFVGVLIVLPLSVAAATKQTTVHLNQI